MKNLHFLKKRRLSRGNVVNRLTLLTLVMLTLCQITVFAQNRKISGKVISDEGAPLAGVTVTIKGGTNGTATGADGAYSLMVPPKAVLVFSTVGFGTQEFAVGGSPTLDIRLARSNKSLDEVVVVGYGTAKRKDLTGSVSSVNADQIAKVPISSIDQALQGRAAGVQVTNNDGTPGNTVSVTIRGVGSLAGNNDPLYVVDGYPISGGLNNLNPNDIATMDVLKDASATAIYGVRAAGGVVIITTKKGRKNGTQISVDGYTSVQAKPKEYKVLNAEQWATLANEDKAHEGTFQELPEWLNPSSLTNVDWQNAVYRAGLKQNYNVAIRGGDEKVQTAFSVGYYDQKGIVLGSYFKRVNLGLNLDYKPFEWLKSSTSVKYARQDQKNPFGTGPLGSLSELIPTITGNKFTNQIKDQYGNYGFYNPVNIYTKSWGNAVYTIETNDYKNLNNYFLANSSLEATIFDGLKLKTNLGTNVSDFSGYYFQPTDNRSSDQYNLGGALQQSFFSKTANNSFEWLWENTISYDKTFGKHSISFVGGYSAQKISGSVISGQGNNLPNNTIRDLSQVSNLTITKGNDSVYTLASQFARLSYKFSDKYLITGTIRRDGSSKFASGHQYGVFPSGAVAWKVKEESFLQDVNWLSDLKIRGSYGEVGNQNSIPLFQYAALYSSGGAPASATNYGYPFNKVYQPGIAPTQPANPNLKWETDQQTDIGMDAAFLNGALNLTVDYYNKKSKDFLLDLPQSAQTGYSQPLAENLGSISNKGFEFALNYNHAEHGFQYGIAVTLTTVQNKLLSINKAVTYVDNVINPNGINASGWAQFSRSAVGHTVGEFFGYKSLGIFQTQKQISDLNAIAAAKFPTNPYYWQSITQPGDRYFADVNGDGQVTPSDRTSLGSPIPKFYGGLNLDASYKSFDVNVYFYGTYGNKIFNYQKRNLESFQAPGFVGVENVGVDYYLHHWTTSNPSNRYARVTYNDDVSGNNVASSAYIENGSYLRLKNLTVGYTLPLALVKKIAATRVRIYFSAQNLFTITGYSGLDPEIGLAADINGVRNSTAGGIDVGTYPSSRFYTAGLNVTF